MQFVMPNGHVRYEGPVVSREMLPDLPEEAEPVYTDREKRGFLRGDIARSAGDTLSLLGTASDGSALALYHLASLIKGLHGAQSLEDVRAAAAAFEPAASSFLSKVDAGAVKLPFLVKGEAEVMTEIETRATAVADALAQLNGGENA